ncbi:hypothetical protein LCGC14_0536250 [marine sediment metagenome]|uniref:Uncharacterized protein n=1 Tax=marine sediment metagenome TaxID=412755 RepID=A0A0F9V2D2_9ZZZZ
MQKRQPYYEYTRALKKQPQAIQDMINAGEKEAQARAVKKKAAKIAAVKSMTTTKKKPMVPVKMKKKPTLFQKTRKRLRKVFGRKGY